MVDVLDVGVPPLAGRHAVLRHFRFGVKVDDAGCYVTVRGLGDFLDRATGVSSRDGPPFIVIPKKCRGGNANSAV